MSARDWNGAGDAEERSAVYAVLARAFTYEGAGEAPFAIGSAEYTGAFDPSVSEFAVSLREGAHVEDDQSALFEELVRFYEFFGLGRGEGAEMPDHLGVELEFMHYLTHLEAGAAAAADLDSLRRVQRDFLARHVSRLLRGLRNGLDVRCTRCAELVATCAEFIAADLDGLNATGITH